jgi:hypothetical protein
MKVEGIQPPVSQRFEVTNAGCNLTTGLVCLLRTASMALLDLLGVSTFRSKTPEQ